ncbi:MAG: 2-dehydropantoate 2-reductase [Bacteroidales bacterium]
MKIAIIGIGGIGGYISSKLCSTDHAHKSVTHNTEIILIQRGKHGEKIKENGLTYEGKTTEIYYPDAVYKSIHKAGILDYIIVCTKSKDLEQTVSEFSNHLHEKSCIITLLNGVNNAERIQKILPRHRVLQGCIYVSASIKKPGIVQQIGGAGKVFIGPENDNITETDNTIYSIFNDAGIPTVLTEDITTEVWKKYLFICTFATITSRYNKPIGKIVRNEKYVTETKQLLTEIISVAHSQDISITKKDKDNVIKLAYKIPENTPTSMQLDVHSGKKPEIDILTKYIIDQAEKNNIDVPLHKKMYTDIQNIIEKNHG